MLALTLWRPWHAAILHLGKNVENRPWAPPAAVIGQTIALHAGQHWDDDGAAFIAQHHDCTSPEGALYLAARKDTGVVGTARVVCYAREHFRRSGLFLPVDLDAVLSSPWFFGPYGWLLNEITPLRQPVPCRGHQKLWTLPPYVERAVLAG